MSASIRHFGQAALRPPGSASATQLPSAPAEFGLVPLISFTDADIAALRQGPPLMMSDLATAAEMLEIDGTEIKGTEETPCHSDSADGAGAALVVKEILANAGSRDRTRGIGF